MSSGSSSAEGRPAPKFGGYVPFIDGMRAVSIISVVLYHIGATVVPGGFLGVDVFFVISGYLIIGQIRHRLDRGDFSFSEFWARRAVRILPPYALVICATIIFAPIVFVLPIDYARFGREVIASSLLGSNIYYLLDSDYFSAAAESRPLLHLWSLAVEEQFYLVAPILIYACRYALDSRVSRVFAMVGFAISLGFCVYLSESRHSGSYSFYLTPFRAWEFMAGGFALHLSRLISRLPRSLIEACAIIGLSAVVFSITQFEVKTSHPSFWTTIPVFGATLLIASGLAFPKGLVLRVLSIAPLVWIGLLSYGWYLWHWPLIVFGRIYNFNEKLLAWDVGMLAISFVLAIQTRHFLERPLAKWAHSRDMRSWKPTKWGAIGLAHTALAGYIFLSMISPRIEQTTPGAINPAGPLNPMYCKVQMMKDPGVCLSTWNADRFGLIVGDSHALSAYRVLANHSAKSGFALASAIQSACFPSLDSKIYGSQFAGIEDAERNCTSTMELARRWVANNRPEYVIFYARWNIYTPWVGQPLGGAHRVSIGRSNEDKPSSNQKDVFVSSLRATLSEFAELGVKRILVVGPTPEFNIDGPSCVARVLQFGMDPDVRCVTSRAEIEKRRITAISWIKLATAGLNGVRFVDPLPAFCDTTLCRVYGSGAALLNDDDHLSDFGIELLNDRFSSEFDWVFNRRSATEMRQ